MRSFWKGKGRPAGLSLRVLRYDDARGLAQLVLRVDRDVESHLFARFTMGDLRVQLALTALAAPQGCVNGLRRTSERWSG